MQTLRQPRSGAFSALASESQRRRIGRQVEKKQHPRCAARCGLATTLGKAKVRPPLADVGA